MERDWTANNKSTYATLGASNHSDYERAERDFYATHPDTTRTFLNVEKFSKDVWNSLLVISTVFLLLALASCRTHKSVTEQVSKTSTDSASVHKTDSVARELMITIKDSTEVRDSVATEYIIGKYDSVAGAGVDTLKQSRWHYERKATDRDKTDSSESKAMATIATTTSKTDTTSTVVSPDSQKKTSAWTWAIAALLLGLIMTIGYLINKRYFNKK